VAAGSLISGLEERLAATLGRQAEALEQVAADVRLVACLVDRAYVGLLGNLGFHDMRDVDSRSAQVNDSHALWRKAAARLWRDGGLAFHDTEADDEASGGGGR